VEILRKKEGGALGTESGMDGEDGDGRRIERNEKEGLRG
jgi:hypothetical protein